MAKPPQPFLVKDGKKIIGRGTRSKCMTKFGWMIQANDTITIVRNSRYKWSDRERDK